MKQPTIDAQQQLNSIIENKADVVTIRGKKFKLRYLIHETLRKVTDIILEKKGGETKVSCKCAAAMLLNDHWKLKMFWWFKWRWMYYVRQYREAELRDLIELGKKKVDVESYYLNTTYLIGLKDTMMAMTREEVERFLAGQAGGQ